MRFPILNKQRKDTERMKHLERFFQPDGWQEGSFTNRQGKKIRTGHATPKGACKGTVVITTGYADFTEAYFETIHNYLDRGYAVWMMDWAGHGGSEKIRKGQQTDQKKVAILDDHIADLEQFRKTVVEPAAGKPVFLSTHSMGGQVALNCALDLYKHGVLAEHGVELIGASRDAIDLAEDREKFRNAMTEIGLESPSSGLAHSWEEARELQRRHAHIINDRGIPEPLDVLYPEPRPKPELFREPAKLNPPQ